MNSPMHQTAGDHKDTEGRSTHQRARSQGSVLFTTPAGDVSTSKKSSIRLEFCHSLVGKEERNSIPLKLSAEESVQRRRESAPARRISFLQTLSLDSKPLPYTAVKQQDSLNSTRSLYTSFDMKTPMRKPLINKETNLKTPGSRNRAPVPSSARKKEVALRLKIIETQELHASRQSQAKRAECIQIQESILKEWLNFVLKQPMKTEVKKDASTEKYDSSDCLSVVSSADTVSFWTNRSSETQCSTHQNLISSLSYVPSSTNSSTFARVPRPPSKLKPRAPSSFSRGNGKKMKIEKEHRGSICPEKDEGLNSICSLHELRQRLDSHIDPSSRDEIIAIMLNVSKHIDDGRLKMKEGCAILNDIALKQKALRVIMSYTPFWLKTGFEVLGFSNLLTWLDVSNHPQSEENGLQDSLLEAVLEKHFFSHSDISRIYASNKSIDGLYRHGFENALAKVILKRILLFVLVLDRIKCISAIQSCDGIDGLDGGSPLLFRPNSNVKSSPQALQEFLLNAMHGEGDLTSHLNIMGYRVFHVQAPLSEYKFEISNLIEDLQDGVRLCRLAQLMLNDASILLKVRLSSNVVKGWKNNCELALERFERAGVPLVDNEGSVITADDIMFGDRDKGLMLLWNVVLYLQIPQLLDKKMLSEEILRVQYLCPTISDDMTLSVQLAAISVLDSLLKWAKEICKPYGFPIENFKESFSDGKALCYILNFYMPSLLPREAICGADRSKSPNLTVHDAAIINLRLAQSIVHKLGNVPEVLRIENIAIMDPCLLERNIIIYLAFLCSQLLGRNSKKLDGFVQQTKSAVVTIKDANICTSDRAHAASTIQAIWRGYRVRRHYTKKKVAARIIQDRWRKAVHNREKKLAAVLIQTSYRGWHQRQLYKLEKDSCIRIQFAWKSYVAHKKFMQQNKAAMIIQQQWRRILAINKEREMANAATTIQAYYHGWRQKCYYNLLLTSSIRIQSAWQAYVARKKFVQQNKAAVIIQQQWHKLLANKKKHQMASAATIIQAYYRGWHQKRSYNMLVTGSIRIQSAWQAHVALRQFKRQRNAAQVIQHWWRRVIQKNQKKMIEYVCCRKIQSAWRSYITCKQFKKQKRAAKVIQAWWRNILTGKKDALQKTTDAAVQIQTWYRQWHQRMCYKKLISSVYAIQSAWWVYSARKDFLKQRRAVRSIQTWWRSVLETKEKRKRQGAATVIQALYKGWQQRRFYKSLVISSRRVQFTWKTYIARKRFLNQKRAATVIQRKWRETVHRQRSNKDATAWLENACYTSCILDSAKQKLELEVAATRIQACYKSWSRRKLYRSMVSSCCKIQSAWRTYILKKHNLGKKDATKPAQIWWQKQQVQSMTITPLNIQIFSQDQSCEIASFGEQFMEPTLVQHHHINHVSLILRQNEVQISQHSQSEANLQPALQTLNRWTRMLKQRKWFVNLRACVLTLQKRWRIILMTRLQAAVSIQSYFRGWRCRIAFKKARISAIFIQASWKGHQTRKHKNEFADKLKELRQRMQNTAAAVDQNMTLGNRLNEALAALLSYKTITGIIHVCATIDLATQHSRSCCERLTEGGAVSKLMQLIQTTNRSPPHEQVLKHALSILRNLSRYPALARLILYTPHSLNIITEQLQMFRNKEEIFFNALDLLKQVCKVSTDEVVQRMPIVLRRLQHIAELLDRKLEVERRNLERLPATALVSKSASEKRISESKLQLQLTLSLLKLLTGTQHKRRCSAPSRKSIGTPATLVRSRRREPRLPLRDCTNG